MPGSLPFFATCEPKTLRMESRIHFREYIHLRRVRKLIYLILLHMFKMTSDALAVLKSVIARFGKDSISMIKGENVFLATKQLSTIVKSLAQVDALSDKTVSDVMDGLSKGSVFKFTYVFKL